MRYTQIHIEGEKGRYATIQSVPGGGNIKVEILLPDFEKTHYVQADCIDYIESMAKCLAHHLSGDESLWKQYLRPLNLIAESLK